MSRDNDQIKKRHVKMTNKEAYISKKMKQKKSFLNFPSQNINHFATSALSQRPNTMAHNTTASLDKLTCTDYVDYGKCDYVDYGKREAFFDLFFGPKRIPITWL